MTREFQETSRSGKEGKSRGRKRLVLILLESALVVALALVWFLSEEVRESTHLLVLFFYSFPSEFLVGLIPHEPALVLFGAHYSAWVVALVAVVGTVMAEGLNYSLFGLFYEMEAFREALDGKTVRKLAELFGRFPFAAILVAGFTPVPFFPVRFLVVMAGYPVWKYLLGVFLARAPRFFILAFFGGIFQISNLTLGGLFLVMLLSVNIPSLAQVLNGKKPETELR